MIEKLDIENFYKCNNIWDMDKKKFLADKFYQELLDNNRITFVYNVDGEYLGEVSLVFEMNDSDYTIKDKRIYVSRFLVKKEYRHTGIGTKLMNYIINYANKLGYEEMSVGVDLDNYIAIMFYVKNGFDKIIFVGEDEEAKYLKLLKKLNRVIRMESFYLEEPSISRKEDSIEYIQEHYKYNSNINGSGCLDDYLENKSYEEWLEFLNDLKTKEGALKYGWVPSRTYFLVRENDNRIIGMINIRLELNDNLRKHGGHIGYGIRPTERKKGYNKINLYLGLEICKNYNIKEVYLDADELNLASWRTMEALGGIFTNTFIENNKTYKKYIINTEESLNKHKDNYYKLIKKNIRK